MGVATEVLRAAERHADAPAIVHNGAVTTYGELIGRAQAVAAGLTAGETVAVPAVRGVELIVDFLGVLLAGATYCPIDPALPAARRTAMLDAAGCTRELGAGPPPARAAAGTGEPGPEGIAYVLFTSGSTGTPRPVEVPHRAVTAVAGSLRQLFAATPADRFLQFASPSWDTCFEEILPALTSGATLVIDDDAHSGSFARILGLLARERISVLNLPTAFWHELVLHLAEERVRLPESVRLVVIGGEGINPARLATWRDLPTGDVRLLNTYGCTETALITHAADLWGPSAVPAVTGLAEAPIGRPLPHVRQRLEPHGALGLLHVGGPSVARGYRGDPEATAQRFTDGWFRTGDLVEEAPDGVLLYRGRVDRQLKVRGVRIDPGDVEAEIIRCAGVPDAAVIGVPLAGRTALIAYVVGAAESDAESLLARLRGAMPAHLVPARLLVRAALPRTTSGKTDYARLSKEWSER
ncbi:amino acid adenylation domain-containing protein [Nucisporomicrobium flavum]|uniref:amino acid adenylation domain-containing protein n=1 Tax=Nucisporomicrobium flavum TaxID=2785915 RepID=UPI003C2E78BE